MKTKLRTLALSTIAAVVLVGCGGVDEQRLAELTGDKNFEQVKIAYVTALALEKKEDLKIYEHWLKENGKLAQPTYNFELYKTKINTEYQKQIDIFEKKMKEIEQKTDALIAKHKKNNYSIPYRPISKLKRELKSTAFFASSSAYIKNTYRLFLVKQIEKLEVARKEIDDKKFNKIKH